MTSKSLEQELDELAGRLVDPLVKGETWFSRANDAARELCDVLAIWLDATDAENQVAELARFRRDVGRILQERLAGVRDDVPIWARKFFPLAVEWAADLLVDYSVEYGIAIDQVLKLHVVGRLRRLEQTLEHAIASFDRIEG